MQPEPKRAAASAEAITICPNCHVPMPSTLRFCRSCGFRLGEGVAEYAETMRLNNQASTAGAAGPATAPSRPPQTGAAAQGPGNWAPIAPVAAQPIGQASAYLGACGKKLGRRRAPWIVWVVLGVTVASVTTGGLLTPFGLRSRSRTAATASATRSYLGLESLKTTQGGVTFDYVYPPGGAADKAGLVGGDIITSFDGQTVLSDDQLTKLLTATPIGKTVEVVYIRDGQTNRTQLTTISADERNRLKKLFESRPEGQGFLGIEDWERVQVQGTNIYGVQLTDVAKNQPGYIAGLRNGDIIIEFEGVPIRTSRELVARIERTIPDTVVKIVVMRGGERLEIPVKIGVD
ncbi:MAG TPA: PDZ domain-containing protein [Pyrinomonadaceae bacterium]|jgi:S1-C subfamily serine protease